MVYIAYDKIYAHPLPEGHRFPMLKYELIPEQLIYEGLVGQSNFIQPSEVSEEDILLTHEASYWNKLKTLSLSFAEVRRMGFPISEALIKRERIIAQGSIDVALLALKNGVGFNVAGGTHHAGSNWAEGFCMLNDQAIAANVLIHKHSIKKVLIVDLDVHQGNGTAEIFQNDARVFTFSMHGKNNFPYRKTDSDLDIHLEDQTQDDDYLALLKPHYEQILNNFQPDFIFYQAGVDVLSSDTLGRLSLSLNACKQRDEIVIAEAKKRNIPISISMGGGYSKDIRIIVDAHCNTYRTAINFFD